MELERAISRLLLRLGISPKLLGYKYLVESIKLVYANNKYLRCITTQLYPTVAEKYNTTAINVDRAIRHSISITFQKKDEELLNEIFSYVTSFKSWKPSNSEFILTMAEYIRINQLVY